MTGTVRFTFSLLLAAVLLSACGTAPKVKRYSHSELAPRDRSAYYETGTPAGIVDTVSYWEGEGVSGSPKITIDLSQQRAFFYKGGKLVGVSKVSTGDSKHPTPTGNFSISQKSRHHESNLYGRYVYPDGRVAKDDVDTTVDPKPPGTRYDGADMPYFLRFNGGVGTHAGYLPGFPASHGCVRMPEAMARHFYENSQIGTPVSVVY